MSRNPNYTKLDWQAAFRQCIDAESDALRVLLQNIQLELDGEDGDSVLSLPQNATITEATPFDAKRVRKATLYATGEAKLFASPLDAGDASWFEIASTTTTTTLDVCARRLKMQVISGQAFLVVRS